MLPMLIDAIRVAGRRFSEARGRESDGRRPSCRGASGRSRAAPSVVRKLLLVALTLNAFAAQAQTTAIVASGLWNGVTFTPSCNYTTQYAWNITYANGA